MSQMLFIFGKKKVKQNCIDFIQSLNEERVWDVYIKKHRANRSKQQNSLYWMWMKIIGDHVGCSKEDMHRTFAIRLLGPEEFEVDGNKYMGARSTTKLTTNEFSEYLDAIYATARAMDIKLPTPEFLGMEASEQTILAAD